MKRILKGKDIHFTWNIALSGEATDLADVALTVELTDSYGVKSVMAYEVVDSSTIEFEYFGINQKHAGPCKLVAWVNKGLTSQSLIDKGVAFELVEFGDDDFSYDSAISLELESSLTIGLKGASAYDVAVLNGFVGTVDEWVESLKGESAYEVWLDAGNEGTVEDFLDSLKGTLTDEQIAEVAEQVKESVSADIMTKSQADNLYQPKGDYALKEEIPDISGLETAEHAAETYQPKGNYLTEHQSLADYVKNDDERLSDARTPTAHSHAISDVTGLQSTLDGKASADSLASLAAYVGNPSDLKTTSKTDLVVALNEVYDKLDEVYQDYLDADTLIG